MVEPMKDWWVKLMLHLHGTSGWTQPHNQLSFTGPHHIVTLISSIHVYRGTNFRTYRSFQVLYLFISILEGNEGNEVSAVRLLTVNFATLHNQLVTKSKHVINSISNILCWHLAETGEKCVPFCLFEPYVNAILTLIVDFSFVIAKCYIITFFPRFFS